MHQELQWIKVVLFGLTVGLTLGFISYFRASLETVLAQGFSVFYRPLQHIQTQVAAFVRSVYQWLGGQIALENETDNRHAIYRIVGSVIITVLFALFLYCDLGVTVLTLGNFGFGHIDAQLPADPLWATAGAIILSSILWGIVFFDSIGLTHLTAWHERLSERGRKAFAIFSVAMGLMTIAVLVGGLTYWRAIALHTSFDHEGAAIAADFDSSALTLGTSDSGVRSSGSVPHPLRKMATEVSGIPSFWLIFLTLGGITLLSYVGSAVSMNGFVTNLKYLALALAFLLSLPVALLAFLLWLPVNLLDGLYNLVLALLTAISNFGQPVLRLLGIKRTADGQNITAAAGGAPATGSSNDSQTQTASQTQAQSQAAQGSQSGQSHNQASGSAGEQNEDVHFDPFRF